MCFLALLGCKQVIVKVVPTIISVTTTPPVVTSTTATISGNISDDGGDPITDRGVVYSLNPSPTIESGTKLSSGSGVGSFNSTISGLSPGKTYYIRTFATNSVGTAYGDQITITTTKVAPSVTPGSSNPTVTSTSVTITGNITADGGDAITARGVVYSLTNQNPTLLDSKTTDGSGLGSFTSVVTGLLPGKTYYFKTYATNGTGTTYGDLITLSTPAVAPTITTTVITGLTAIAATSGGTISSDGGAAITARGVVWNTSTNPTLANAKTVDGTTTGTFTSNLTGLTPNTNYYVKAYATNSVGTTYGNEVTFKTLLAIPTVGTNAVTNVTSTTASCGGNVTLDNGAPVTARGVCWSTSQNPTTSDSKTSDGTGTGIFTSSITGLNPNTTYYFKAYAINSVGTGYGTQFSFTTTASLPTVTTATLTNITSISATAGGVVVSDGGATVTSRGVCWGTSTLPTINDSKLVLGSGIGTFSGSITGLLAGVNYYVRAFATNSAGTSYGIAMSVNGLTADINNLVGQNVLDELKRLGMQINGGVTPPTVTGIFNITPFILKNSNIPGDYAIGYQFYDTHIQFSNQDNSKLTVTVDEASFTSSGAVSSTSTSTGSFVVGSGKLFTVFVKILATRSTGETADLVEVISGTIEPNGVSNLLYANYMIDNHGYTQTYMDNNSARIIYDSDGMSERISSLKSAKLNSMKSTGRVDPSGK